MKKQWVYVIIALVVVLGVAIGVTRRGGDEIKIGANFELTGDVASFGNSTYNGVKLAVDEINEAGGILGRKVKLVEADNKSANTEATNMATKLITKDKVVALIGPTISSNAMAAGSVAQEKGIPMMSPTATAREYTEIGDYIFRACFLDDFQARAMADFAYNELGARKAAMLVNAGDPYSTGLATYFKERFTALGGTIVVEERFQQGDTEFRPQLTKIKGANVDTIYVPAYYNDDGAIARQAREMGITASLIGPDGWDSAKLVEVAGAENLNNVYFTNHYTPSDPSEVVQNFVAKYQERYGQVPDALAALGYDGARVLLEAIKQAGSTDPKAIRDALASIENFQGLGAVITMGADRNPVKDAVIVELKNGEQHLRGTVKP